MSSIDRVGAVVMGRHTFDLGLTPWGGTPWPGVPSFVVTHRLRPDLVCDNGGTFTFAGLTAAVQRARESAGDKDVLVMGADVAGQLLTEGLPEGTATGKATHLRFRAYR